MNDYMTNKEIEEGMEAVAEEANNMCLFLRKHIKENEVLFDNNDSYLIMEELDKYKKIDKYKNIIYALWHKKTLPNKICKEIEDMCNNITLQDFYNWNKNNNDK